MRRRIARRVLSRSVIRIPADCALALCLCCLSWPVAEIGVSAEGLAAQSASAAPRQGDAGISVIDPARPVDRQLGGGQSHAYQITLAAGWFIHLSVEQKGIDVVASLFGPDGKKIAEIDSPNGTQGREEIRIVPETAGNYRLEISSLEKTAAAGRYELKVIDLRVATGRDRNRDAAEKKFAEAEQLRLQKTAESLGKAIERYQEALPLWRAAEDRLGEARTHQNLGAVYDAVGKNKEALESFKQALPLRRAENDLFGQAETINSMGAVYYALGDLRQAIELFNQALPIVRSLGMKREEAYTLTNIGLMHGALGETQKAIELYQRSLPLLREVDDRNGEAATLNNLGLAYWSSGEQHLALDNYLRSLAISRELKDAQGEALTLSNIGAVYDSLAEFQKAREYYEQSLPLFRKTGDRRGEIKTLNNLGAVYSSIGESQQALNYYGQALKGMREAGEQASVAATLNNLGMVYNKLGEDRQAADYYNQSLELARAVGDRRLEAAVLNNLGTVHGDLGEHRQARAFHEQALALRRELKSRAGEAQSLNNLAAVYRRLGQHQQSHDYLRLALDLWRAAGDRAGEASTLNNLGNYFVEKGERDEGIAHLDQALRIWRAVKDPREEANTLISLARAQRDRGRLDEARGNSERALKIVEDLRNKVAGRQLRTSYFATVREYYDTHIDLLMRLHGERPGEGHAVAALQTSEQARARTLLETLNEARVDLRRGVDPALLEKEISLRQLITAKADRQVRLLSRQNTQTQADRAAKELESLAVQYQEVEAQIRAASPGYAALAQPQPLPLAEVQRELDPGTLLLEYALGEKRSFLWAVTANSIESFELPGRSEIEEAANRVYEYLIERAQSRTGETPAQRQSRIARADAGYAAAAAGLSRVLLSPVAAQLGTKRLVIIPDGKLQYVPFSALPAPETGRQREEATAGRRDRGTSRPKPPSPLRPSVSPSLRRSVPLIVDHEIIHLPSAATLAALRRESAGRKPAPKDVAILADPVFDVTDLRVRRGTMAGEPASKSQSAPSQNVTIRAVDNWLKSGMTLDRLVFSQREADAVRSLVPESRRKIALGFDVNYRTATDLELGQYRIVHFSTHGLLNSSQPELSGILLSLVDEQGHPQENGLLRLGEIYNLKLPVELVVLSSCQTALGKEVRGEGLVGLTRGFMHSGASRVMASLWKVDDRATAELMLSFYREMLGPRHARPADALRKAQISMWRSRNWSAPFYWSAFTIQGEWK